MKSRLFLAAALFFASVIIISCGGKDKKKDDTPSTSETTIGPASSDDGLVPRIDIRSLKDEASVLDAMQKVVDARVADEKKQKDDPNYSGHYVELTKLYTDVLNASTAYSRTISDPAKALEFMDKISAIQNKMYAK